MFRYSSSVKRLLGAVTLILFGAVAVSAQFYSPTNARKIGMANAPQNDISDVYNYTALMFEYQDKIQATFGGANSGILGIKAVNEGFMIGVAANQGLMANQGIPVVRVAANGDILDTVFIVPSFAGTAVNTLTGILPQMNFFGEPILFGETPSQFNIPHLLLGMDVGSMKLGADVFFEYSRYSNLAEYGTAAGTGSNRYSGLILNPGARFSANIGLENAAVLAKLGISFPSFEAKTETSAPGGATTTNTTKSNKGLYIETGAELSLPISDLEWTFGASYIFSDHSIRNNPASYWNSNLSLYVSNEFNVLETATASVGYKFTRLAGTITNTVTVGDVTNRNKEMAGIHWHSITAGMENIWTKAYFVDNFAIRAGASYDILNWVGKSSNNQNDDFTSAKNFAQHLVTPTMGFGASKSFLTIDVYCSMGNWDGLFMGPPVGMVTGTVKF